MAENQSGRRQIVSTVLNVAGFQIGWFASIWCAANAIDWAGPVAVFFIVAVQLVLFPNSVRRESSFLAAALLIGYALETGHIAIGVMITAGEQTRWPICPLWLPALWVNLAITMTRSLRWLDKHRLAACVLGAIGGPLSYWTGARLGAVTLDSNATFSLAALAIVWGTATPGLLYLARRMVSAHSELAATPS